MVRNNSGMPNAFPQFKPQIAQPIVVEAKKTTKFKKAGSAGVLIHVVLDESTSMGGVTQNNK